MLTAYALQFLCMHSDQHCTVSTYMFLMAIITSPFSTKTYIFFGKKRRRFFTKRNNIHAS
jgi:hypothetical protein